MKPHNPFLEDAKRNRSLETLMPWLDNNGNRTNYLDFNGQSSFFSQGNAIGITDNIISPLDLWELSNKDTFFSGLIDQFVTSVFKNGFFVKRKTDKNGVELGTEAEANKIYDILLNWDIMKKMQKRTYGKWFDGGGNYLWFTYKNGSKIDVGIENFLDSGMSRVQVFGNDSLQKISKYEVIDGSQQVVYNLDPTKGMVYHGRYSQGGDYRFSSNPAKKAVYPFILKKYIQGANQSRFTNGMQDPVVMTPNYDKLKSIFEYMQSNKISGQAMQEFMKNPIKFAAKLSEKDNNTIQTEMVGARNANKILKLSLPQDITKVATTNKDMQSIELIELCNNEMQLATRISKGVISTQDSKYSNAEVEADNFNKFVVDPEKSSIEWEINNIILEWIYPAFDKAVYEVRFGRDPDAEDLEIFRMKTERANAVSLLINPNKWEFNPETFEWEKLDATNVDSKQSTVNKDTITDKKEKDDVKEDRADKTVVTPSDKALKSPDAKKFQRIIKNAVENQLEGYIKKVSKYDDIKEARKNIKKDFPALSSSGLSVNTLKQQLIKQGNKGVKAFEEETKEVKRAMLPFLVGLFDAKAVLLLKGWQFLDKDQQKDISEYFGDDFKGYEGLDEATRSQVETMLRDSEDLEAFTALLNSELVDIATNRSNLIYKTETAQSVEASRYAMYEDEGYTKKKWASTRDKRVRPAHRQADMEGWIGINEAFRSGVTRPSWEKDCRCTLLFDL